MGEEVENACCSAWRKKYSKLADKYAKLEELKNKLRDCTSLVNQQYGVLEKENISLKQALEELKIQADGWKREKEHEFAIRVDREGEVSSLKDEIRLLQQNSKSDRQLDESLKEKEKEMNCLKELVEKEKSRADLEKKNVDIEKKRANEALKKLQSEKNKVKEVQKAVDIERKKADESKLLWERLKTEIDVLKSKLRMEVSKSEAANKKVKEEIQNTIKQKERADLAMAKAEEQQKLAETNLSKGVVEKDRADYLHQTLKDEKKKIEKLEELYKHVCSKLLIQDRVDPSDSCQDYELKTDTSLVKKGTLVSQGVESVTTRIHPDFVEVGKRAGSESKKAKKHREVAEAHKRKAIEERHRADQLSRMLGSCELRLEELQEKCHISHRTQIDSSFSHTDNPDRYMVKLLKKELKLEKMLVKHAKETTKVEVLRNKMLHQELFHMKQRFHLFQLQLDKLNSSFTLGGEGIRELEKVDNRTFTKEKNCCDGHHQKHLVSGTTSRLDPPYRGSNEKLSKSSAINSSSASFSDLPLVGSQERGALSITTSAKLNEEVTNFRPTLTRLSSKSSAGHDWHAVPKSDESIKSFIKGSTKKKVKYQDQKNTLAMTKSKGNLVSEDLKLQEKLSEKVSVLHCVHQGKNEDPSEQNVRENICGEMSRPLKRRKTTSEESEIINPFQSSDGPEVMVYSNIDDTSFKMETRPPSLIQIKPDEYLKGEGNNIGSTNCDQQDFWEIIKYDHMKLLDLDNAADEEYYRRAIAKPLSPTLPEIIFEESEPLGVDTLDVQVVKTFQEGSLNGKKDQLLTSEFGIMDMERDLNLTTEKLDIVPVSDACLRDNNAFHGMFKIPQFSVSKNEETHESRDSKIDSTPLNLPRYLVLPLERKDTCSMLRILQRMGQCSTQCSTSLHQSVDVFLRSVLLFLTNTEELSSKDRVCLLFSMILSEISVNEANDLPNVLNYDLLQSLHSTGEICSVLSDLVLKRVYMKPSFVLELMVLIEHFLLQRKVLVCGDVSSTSLVCSSNFVINDRVVTLFEQTASSHQALVAGYMFASLCSELDCVDLVCEVSCKILMFLKFDRAIMLAILHSFVLACNSKYLTCQKFTLTMRVVKSLVIFLEKEASSVNFTSNECKSWSYCTSCPFLDGAVSMEDASVLLLQNLQKYGQSTSCSENSLELEKSLVHPTFSFDALNENVSVLREAFPVMTISDENILMFVDILSLVELISNFMTWEWTFSNFICQLLQYLESCKVESVCVAVMVLLSHLGRHGVTCNGYKDSKIEILRERLTSFFHRSTKNLSIRFQFATAAALFGLVPYEFEEIIATESTTISKPVDIIRKWFLLLSQEQQLSFRLYQDSNQTYPDTNSQAT